MGRYRNTGGRDPLPSLDAGDGTHTLRFGRESPILTSTTSQLAMTGKATQRAWLKTIFDIVSSGLATRNAMSGSSRSSSVLHSRKRWSSIEMFGNYSHVSQTQATHKIGERPHA